VIATVEAAAALADTLGALTFGLFACAIPTSCSMFRAGG
jgi:hypothetical protein